MKLARVGRGIRPLALVLSIWAVATGCHADPVRPAPAAAGKASPPDDGTVRRVHHAALTVDAHIDLRPDFDTPGNEAGRDTIDQFDLPKLERGDLDVATVALFADPQRRTPANVAAARAEVELKLAALRRFVGAHPDRLAFATRAADLEQIAGQGKHAILLGFLNALSLGTDLSLIDHYYREGVRVFGFAHIGNNEFAYSSRPSVAFGDDPTASGGLTPLGREAVGSLNRLGVIIDVSQLTRAGVLETVALSRAPVIASHSGVRARVDVPRNLSEDELRAIAARGGVVHIVAFHAYVKPSPEATERFERAVLAPFGLSHDDDPKTKLDAEQYGKYLDAYRTYSRGQWKFASLSDYVDSIDAAVRLIGIDHVGISSDFNHGGGVTGFANVGEAPNVTRELLARGYSEADIGKLWGGNFLRVFEAVERTARAGYDRPVDHGS